MSRHFPGRRACCVCHTFLLYVFLDIYFRAMSALFLTRSYCMQSSCGDEGLPCSCEDVAYLEEMSPSLWRSVVRQRSDIVASYGTQNVEGTTLYYDVLRYEVHISFRTPRPRAIVSEPIWLRIFSNMTCKCNDANLLLVCLPGRIENCTSRSVCA